MAVLSKKDLQQIINAQEKVFTTKEDMKAARQDLSEFEQRATKTFTTKKDLANFATKKDLEGVRQDLVALERRAVKTFAAKKDLEAFEQRALAVFATKQDLKEAVKDLSTKEDFNNLLTAIDSYTKKADTYFQEMVMLSHKIEGHERWIQQIAEKVGVKLAS